MNRIVLCEIPFNIISLYQDSSFNELEQLKADATRSPPVQWALKQGCNVHITTVQDIKTQTGNVVLYAALTPIQQTEFALRF